VGGDGFSVAAEGDLSYRLAGVNGRAAALRDPMTNATTVEASIGAQILKSNTGFGVTASLMHDQCKRRQSCRVMASIGAKASRLPMFGMV
jgi:hypothetical protein